ncbi:MAG: hypothetical protein M1814_004836 [Vezdaea aestivalis]|nr:MAG: hypothetical protein M1814_004836 [Vezdaea aestivalis]
MPADTNALLTAALSSTTLLTRHAIPHAFFGGFATTTLGCKRSTKDIDLLVHTTKPELVSLLSAPHYSKVWLEINQAREDYVAYLWKGIPDTIVLVEFFFLAADAKLPPTLAFNHYATCKTLIMLDPFHLFLGKLAAGAGRAKASDLIDLDFLMRTFPKDIERGLQGLPMRSRSLQRWGIVKSERKGRGEVMQLLAEVAAMSSTISASVKRLGLKLPGSGSSAKGGANASCHEVSERGRGRKMERGEVQRGLVC